VQAADAVVWRTGALGDFVATLPVLSRLAERGTVGVVGPGRWRALFPSAAWWVDADGLEATAWISGRVHCSAPLGVCWTDSAADALRRSGVATVLVGSPVPSPGVAISDHLWQPVAGRFGPRDRDPRVEPTPEALARVSEHAGSVVISPGSGGARKRWPLERWRQVAARVDGPVLWVGGPVEASESGWGAPRRDDLGPIELAALASICRCWLGPDSGPCHLAAAAGARVGVVFNGATDARIWAPPGARVFAGEVDPAALARFANG
jgi:ADP-heptose:LPS heptosyltransferase